MKIAFKQALAITIPYSFLVSIIFYSSTIEFFALADEGSPEVVYRGFEAVKHIIREDGIFEYILFAAPHYVFFSVTIFFALMIQGVINAKINA